MKIKVEKFIMKQGNRVGKAAIEFEQSDDAILAGFHLLGFTICDDEQKGMFVLFPAALTNKNDSHKREGEQANRPYFFLRPSTPERLEQLETAILDAYDLMVENEFKNRPRMNATDKKAVVPAVVNG